MKKRFLNARSPLRLLEKGLHGGLGAGNLGVVLAAHGVGKTSFLVGVAVDELLREGRVLHVSCAHPVSHVRTHYDTVFEELAHEKHLENTGLIHGEIDRRRSIRVVPPGTLTPGALRDAVKVERDTSGAPSLIVVEGLDAAELTREDLQDLRGLARELDAEIWLESSCADERHVSLPDALEAQSDLIAVIVALEPGDGAVGLRALKDHDNPDVSTLHVSLDPRTLLLVRS